MASGKPIVLTAPLTEFVDHVGYFIQMAMASTPVWMEKFLDRKFPGWKNVRRFADGSTQSAPAGLRVLEHVLGSAFGVDSIVVCYPDDLNAFIGSATRAVAISTMNPLGVTFAAGVYTSIFGSSKQPINAVYAERMFEAIRNNPHRPNYKVILGGTGGWQVRETGSAGRLGVDCIVDGRAESEQTVAIFRKALQGDPLPADVRVGHAMRRDAIVLPRKPTTFGVVEMTTGCGRRCNFCVPDLHPQIDLPRDALLEAVKANADAGNSQVSLATEDMFIWGQVGTDTPFFFPNRQALVELYGAVAETPGVESVVLSHSTIAPAIVDPLLVEQLSRVLLPKSPIKFPRLSKQPGKKAIVPLIGLETGSVRMAKKLMPSKAVPFSIEDWPSIVIRGLEILNRNSWFPLLTIMVGNPGEIDDDVMETLDLVYEIERRGLFGFLIPSVYTPLEGTRMQDQRGVSETRNLSALQWQLIMKCWKFNLLPGSFSWWTPLAFRLGALALWATKLRKTNGPSFTWPLFNFASALPEAWMQTLGKLYEPRPLTIKTRAELLRSVKAVHWRHFPADCGDLPPSRQVASEVAI